MSALQSLQFYYQDSPANENVAVIPILQMEDKETEEQRCEGS